MRRLKHPGLLVLLFLLLILSGCSVRPADGTYFLPSEPSASDSKGTFDLKEVKVQKLDDKMRGTKAIGWQGDELMVYNSAGIDLLNYNTASLTPLLTLSNLMCAALSEDGKKIAYSEIDGPKKAIALYVSDADFKTNPVQLSNTFDGKTFSWSSGGKYLYSHNVNASGNNVFDVSAQAPVAIKIKGAFSATLYDVEDSSNQMLLSLYAGNSSVLYTAGFDGIRSTVQTTDSGSPVSRASFLGSNQIAVLSGGTLSILNTEQKQTVDHVTSYGVSDDYRNICLIKTNASGSYDVYIGNLRDGAIANQTLIYKGMEAIPDSILFSPDDKKIAISGYPKGTPYLDDTLLILTFR